MQQAKIFREAMGVTGIVLTKLDGTAKGGIVWRFVSELGVSRQMGRARGKMDDLQPFDADQFVHALFVKDIEQETATDPN